MAVLNFLVTPANVHDSKLFVPLLSDTQHLASFPDITAVYGDNAYDSDLNKSYLEKGGIEARFHSKDETGKKPKYSRSCSAFLRRILDLEVLKLGFCEMCRLIQQLYFLAGILEFYIHILWTGLQID